MYGTAVLSIINAFIDREAFYSQSLNSLLPEATVLSLSRFNDVILIPYFNTSTEELQLRDFVPLSWYTLITILVTLSMGRVLNHLRQTPLRQTVAMAKLINPALLSAAVLYLPTNIIEADIRYITLAVGLATSFISIKIVSTVL